MNLGASRASARVRFPWPDLAGRPWRLAEALDETAYVRSGDEMAGPGLYVELEPGGWHLFSVRPDGAPPARR